MNRMLTPAYGVVSAIIAQYGGTIMHLLRKFTLSALASLAVTLAAIGAGPSSACAQEATGPYGMQFFVTPYLWLAGIDATTKTPLQRLPEVNSSVGPFQLLGHLDGAPFMGSFEVRQGPLGFLGDVLHVPVSIDITTRNVLVQGGNAALKTNMGTGLVLYRLLDQPNPVRRCRPRLSRLELLHRSVSQPRPPGCAEREPQRGLGRSSDRRSLSLRLWQRVRRYGLWRFRRLRRRCACRLAGDRHVRLHSQLFDQLSSGLSQPQF